MPRGTPAAAARELALALVARGLAAQGEDPTPRVVVVAGPDEGRALPLAEAGRPYVIGRGKDTDLPLEDPAVARRHVAVSRRGDHFLVRDLSGASLDGAALPQGADVAWRPGQILTLGRTEIGCEHPAVEALAELERCPDEPVRPGEVLDPPDLPEPEEEPAPSESAPGEEAPASVESAAAAAPAQVARRARQEPAAAAGGWGLTDAAVVLIALGVLGLSIAGLAWLLGRG
jgi:pSer/pThr/pTyr-binding forkhead associated (FHA) protein